MSFLYLQSRHSIRNGPSRGLKGFTVNLQTRKSSFRNYKNNVNQCARVKWKLVHKQEFKQEPEYRVGKQLWAEELLDQFQQKLELTNPDSENKKKALIWGVSLNIFFTLVYRNTQRTKLWRLLVTKNWFRGLSAQKQWN